MRVEVLSEKTFVPEWNGNRDLDSGEQIKIVHRFLKPGERKKYLYIEPMEFDYSEDKPKSKTKYVQDLEGLARALITKIENLVIISGGKEVLIDTVDKLYNTAGVPQALVAEIEAYILNASPEVDSDFLSKDSS